MKASLRLLFRQDRLNFAGMDGLQQAIDAAGGAAALARQLGITVQAISQWRQVPAERVVAVSRATRVPVTLLRPDLYPHDLVA
jgi:DNA-binding transcriptional regulator YdaS (Cro superfamily)